MVAQEANPAPDRVDPPTRTALAASLKLCLVSTIGGHLAQLEALAPVIAGYDAYLVTVDSAQSTWAFPGLRKYYVHRILRNPAALVLNFVQSLSILLRERPSAVITTGAGDALPTAALAASLGIPVVFVESMARVNHPSLTGRILYRFARLCVIQWPTLSKAYPGAVLAAPIFRPRGEIPKPSRISELIILTGTATRGFESLLESVDAALESHEIRANVFAQIGQSSYIPRNYRYTRFLPHEELRKKIRSADVVVTHDGAGSIGDGLLGRKPIIVIPRTLAGEVSYRSTSELARELARIGWVRLVEDPRMIPKEILQISADPPREIQLPADLPEVVQVLQIFLQSLVIELGEDGSTSMLGADLPPHGLRHSR